MSVTNTVLNSVEAQEKHWALVDCFATWDGSVADQAVIQDGLFARYRAMGKPLKGIQFIRKDLRTVEIRALRESGDEFMMMSITRFPTAASAGIQFQDGESWNVVYPTHEHYFHRVEFEILAKFVLDNVYHS
jgi:hypothetical protein